MFRRHQNRSSRGNSSSFQVKKARNRKLFSGRRFTFERLEDRRVFALTVPALHSIPLSQHTADTKVIYLDFDGHIIRDSEWNTPDFGNLINDPFSLDADMTSFSTAETEMIQKIWARVAEDYSSFDIDVTTVDPGLEAIRKNGGGTTVSSTDVGQVIDGLSQLSSLLTFSGPMAQISDIEVKLDISHTSDDNLSVVLVSPSGTTINLFTNVGGSGDNFLNTILDDQAAVPITDPSASAPFSGSYQPQAALAGLAGQDPNGTWTLRINDDDPLADNGVLNSWSITVKGSVGEDSEYGQRIVIGGKGGDWYTTLHPPDPDEEEPPPPPAAVYRAGSFYNPVTANDTPGFIFSGDLAASDKLIGELASHMVGFALGLEEIGQSTVDDPGPPATFKTIAYPGHGTGETGWQSIMGTIFNNEFGSGTGINKELTQWSKGEYQFAAPVTDQLAAITRAQTGVKYRIDDHGSTTGAADTLGIDSTESTTDTSVVDDSGVIERTGDVDVFSFTLDGIGGVVDFDITPAALGANLDILATIRDSNGIVLYTSNPVRELFAGGQSLDNAADNDGGWKSVATGEYVDGESLVLLPGTYFLSVTGTGKAAIGTDAGYSNYGSLGQYTVTGTIKKNLVVGVEFDAEGGTAPRNWRLFEGGGQTAELTDLITEGGAIVPYKLSISTTGESLNTFSSDDPIDVNDLPDHAIPLADLDGYLSAEDETLTFTWSGLEAWSYHTVYVFGHADFDARNVVTITGGNINGTIQTIPFNQTIPADSLLINNRASSTNDLSTFGLRVLSDGEGKIKITVTNPPGYESAIAGLAIAPTRPIGPAQNGSISGTKWNDLDGDTGRDASEPGLGGWVIYIDENNNGILDLTTTEGQPDETITVNSTNVGQEIPDADPSGVKSTLEIPNIGTIEDITVSLDISHTYVSDLIVTLISPSGRRVPLFSRIGDPGDANFTGTSLNDSAPTSITNASAPYTGTFRPQVSLLHDPGAPSGNRLKGESVTGTWTLEVIDASGGDLGTLNSWSLTIEKEGVQGTTQFLERVVDDDTTAADGTYTFSDLPPGLYYVREYFTPEQIAAGWQQTWAPTPITVTSGADVTGHDFGNWVPDIQLGSINGQKFFDADQDGIRDASEPGLPGWIVYIDQNNNGIRDVSTTSTVVNSTDVPKPIEDLTTAQSKLTVNSVGTVLNLEVTLDITHSFVGDLEVFLTSPSGRRVELFSQVGGQYNDLHNLTLSDNATRSIDTMGFNDLPYTGTWKPEGFLGLFNGDDASGVWTLSIFDSETSDEGVLNSWSLSFNSGEIFRTTDASGNYSFDPVGPGTYIIREEAQAGWTSIAPADTTIPAAVWTNTSSGQWAVTVVDTDDPGNPDGPTSHRIVQNVNFGSVAPLGSISGTVYKDSDQNATKSASEPGLPGWTVFVDTNNNGFLDLGSVNATASSTTAKAINNFFVTTSQVFVGALTRITDLDVTLDISHPYASDLTAYLVSPSGTRVKLFANVGVGGVNFQNTKFDDSALVSISAATAPFAGVFSPVEALSAFNGQVGTGFWTLEITDNSATDDGILNSWSLNIKGDELSTVTNAQGQYTFSNLPPSIYNISTVQNSGWVQTQSASGVTLLPSQALQGANVGQFALPFPGDFNADGFVEAGDFVLWRKQSGSNVAAGSGADGNNDGHVDQADLGMWRANFGNFRDDHGNTAQTATGIASNTNVLGRIEAAGDVDWFKFTATSGTLYHIQATHGTLDAANLQLFATNGTTSLATSSGTSPFIDWTASVNGDYYVRVQSLSGLSTGTYTVTITGPTSGSGSGSGTLLASVEEQSVSSAPAGDGSGVAVSYVPMQFGTASTPVQGAAKSLSQGTSQAASQYDLALLAWLANAKGSSRPSAGTSLDTADHSDSATDDESETLDAAFASLEGNALVSAAI